MIEKLKQDLATGTISRRTFMAGALAMGATVSSASLLVGEAHAMAPQKGGTLRIGFTQGSTSDTFDPATFNNDFMLATGYAVFNTLVELAPDGSGQPDLAESYEASADAKTWTFRLRDEATFSDGKKVTAADVIASIRHHLGENSKSAAKPLLKSIEDIKADGDNTVVFTLTEGNADFPLIFNDYHLGIRPAQADGTIDPDTMIGTGGYVVESFEAGVRAVLKRRDDYWKKGRAHIDRVEILTIADPAARMNALLTGEVDLIDRPDLKTVHMLKRNPNVKLHTQDGTLHYVMPMHSDTAPFDDNNVRLALKNAINRQEFVDKVLKGYGKVGNDQPIASSMQFYNDQLAPRAFDPEKAKYHLKQAGLDTLNVKLHTAENAFGGAVDASLLFSETAKAAGINIEVVREPADGYWSNVWLKKPFCTSYWGGRPTADLMFTTAYAAGADWNESRFNHERFNELLVKARAELDTETRRNMYFEMQQIVSDEGSTIIPAFGQYVSAMTKRVHMPEKVTQLWDLDGMRFIERWWVS
ncbi:ABC transporter substrate-binding protein [Pseudovibrio exalbescens]|uniref:ABC transporter substrate-binding protein n=1 Tax=Pseudovibrio exalbescens TaxID=197461 RepID=UPI000C99DB24|nr:ABC transporter substrate-binding protein [Pseudovibrio exalbescens]